MLVCYHVVIHVVLKIDSSQILPLSNSALGVLYHHSFQGESFEKILTPVEKILTQKNSFRSADLVSSGPILL